MAEANKDGRKTAGSSIDLPIPPNLQKKLESFQQRLWSVKIGEGALVGLFGLALSYLLVFSLDRIVETPTWVRSLILAAGFAVPAIGLPLRWYRWVRKQRSLEQVARLLRRRFPRLGDELLGIVELAHQSDAGSSRTLVEAAMRQVDERIGNHDFDEAVPAPRYSTWMASALGALGLATLLLFLVSDAARNSLARWVSPWKPIERYTFAQIEPLPGSVIVPYAEDFNLNSELADTTEWVPRRASVRLPGRTRLRSDRDGERYEFEIPPQKEEGRLTLRVGDEYEHIEVTPLPRPELVDLEAVIRLPDYLRYPEDPVVPIRGGNLQAVVGSDVRFSATASRALAEVSAEALDIAIDGASFSTAPVPIDEASRFSLHWKDIHGLEARTPLELSVRPVEDEAPDVFARQLSTERVVLVDEVVSFDVSAADDFGIQTLGLQWDGEPGSGESGRRLTGEKPVAAGSPDRSEIEARATFSAAREGVPPQTLQIRAFAEDYLPDRERSFSPTFVLHVLSPADHADWLTREFGKWFRNAREVYEREQQLHESNRTLRALSTEELDRPENRRKIEEQASAESANGRRLGALTEAGRDLVRQATKNDEFDAERLEAWAEMMRSLDDISDNRMPSVADLLTEAARAEGMGAAGKKPEEAQKPSRSEGSQPPSVGNQKAKQSASSGEADDEAEENAPRSPSISDRESSLAESETSEPSENAAEKPPGESPLSLPTTTLAAAGEDDGESGDKPESPAQESLEEAVREQEDLLAEFARVADQLQEILSSLEASTFVKRLKAASRKQTEIAETLNGELTSGFGLPRHRIEQQLRDLVADLAETQREQSRFIYAIQSDLDAYFQRKQEPIFLNVLEQMKQSDVVADVKQVGQETLSNLSGRSISSAEYWADTLDRWAEELVAASDCEASEGQSQSKESLPPELVLRIMKALQDEMYLRDETREMDSARSALAPDVYETRVAPLEATQADLRARVDDIISSIQDLPDGDRKFGKELQLLNLVSDVMRQARGVLARPDTGPEAIAAQTEAIELLLQSNRQNQGGGGGGGGSSPGGGGTASGSGPALSDIAPGGAKSDQPAGTPEREVEQSTGKAGRELPEEFRRGLDSYFNQLESNR